MRLSLFKLGARWTPGRQWSGKHRKAIKMTQTKRRNISKKEKQADLVVAATMKPFLSQEQEIGSGRSKWCTVGKLSDKKNRWMKKDSSTFDV